MEEFITEMYFGTVDGDLIKGSDIAIAALICEKKVLTNPDEIRKYASKCPGITKEVKHPSVRYMIKNNHKHKAVVFYWKKKRLRDPNFSIVTAKNVIDNIELAMKNAGEI